MQSKTELLPTTTLGYEYWHRPYGDLQFFHQLRGVRGVESEFRALWSNFFMMNKIDWVIYTETFNTNMGKPITSPKSEYARIVRKTRNIKEFLRKIYGMDANWSTALREELEQIRDELDNAIQLASVKAFTKELEKSNLM